jgi:hypothetical protein
MSRNEITSMVRHWVADNGTILYYITSQNKWVEWDGGWGEMVERLIE